MVSITYSWLNCSMEKCCSYIFCTITTWYLSFTYTYTHYHEDIFLNTTLVLQNFSLWFFSSQDRITYTLWNSKIFLWVWDLIYNIYNNEGSHDKPVLEMALQTRLSLSLSKCQLLKAKYNSTTYHFIKHKCK